MSDPIELVQLRQMYADARREFARDVDALLVELRTYSDGLGNALGEIGRDDAWLALRRFVLEKFDQRLPQDGD